MKNTMLPSVSWLDDDDILYMFSILTEILEVRKDTDLHTYHPVDLSVIPIMKSIASRNMAEFEYHEDDEGEPKLIWKILNKHNNQIISKVSFCSYSFTAWRPEYLQSSSKIDRVYGFGHSTSPIVIRLCANKVGMLNDKIIDDNYFFNNGKKLGMIERFKYS